MQELFLANEEFSLNGRGLGHVTEFQIFGPPLYLGNG